jgi:hypothetical protein
MKITIELEAKNYLELMSKFKALSDAEYTAAKQSPHKRLTKKQFYAQDHIISQYYIGEDIAYNEGPEAAQKWVDSLYDNYMKQFSYSGMGRPKSLVHIKSPEILIKDYLRKKVNDLLASVNADESLQKSEFESNLSQIK